MSNQTYNRQSDSAIGGAQPSALGVLTSWLGAITSVALVGGLSVWAYQLTMRDVTDVPVVRAMAGPSRVQPDDPGGATTAHQGLAVNSVQSLGAAEDPSDRVVLAPAPVELSDEDLAEINLRPLAESTELASMPQNMTDVSASAVDEIVDIDALVLEAVQQSSMASQVNDLARMPGVKHSPRPKARRMVAALADNSVLSDADKPANLTIDVDPSEVLSGTRLVQLGAFDDVASAKREWNVIFERHGDLIGARQRFIQEAASGGRSFYRLRMVGFESLSDSRRLCSALLARGTPCIPVTAR